MNKHHIIGEIENISFPEVSPNFLKARIDTGAYSSAIWASKIEEIDGKLNVIFFDDQSECYTGIPVTFVEYFKVTVKSSNGGREKRYKVKLLVIIAGRRIKASFTLANRSAQKYPVLIGRNVLRNKFVVDIAKNLKEVED